MKTFFIAFEGLDGSGKGTQAKKVVSYLFDKSKLHEIYFTREPTQRSSEIRERMAEGTDVKKDADWYLKAFVEDRKQHSDIINFLLSKGISTISDRYDLSTYTYQWIQGISFEKIKEAHKGILIPDLTIIYDCPAEIAFERRKKEGATDVFDKDVEFQKELRQAYLKMPEMLQDRKIVIIDSTPSINEIFSESKKHIDELLEK